jgi:hypothetical protein
MTFHKRKCVPTLRIGTTPIKKNRHLNDPETIPGTRTQFLQFQQTDAAAANTQSSAPRLTDLPTEVLLHILSWLPKRDLLILAFVCRRCYEVSNNSSLWRALTFIGPTPTTGTVRLLLRKSTGLRYLKVTGRTDATAIIKEVCRSNKKLRTLIVKRCFGGPEEICVEDRVICNLPNCCRELENITLEETYIDSIDFFDILGRTLPNLKKIHLSERSEALAVFVRNFDKLEEVSVYRSWYRVDKFDVAQHADIDAFSAKMCNTLTVLKLDALCCGDNAVNFIVRCRHLHTLHIHEAQNISDVGLIKLRQLENLTSLGLGDTKLITAVTWIELMLMPPFTRLKRLEFVGHHAITKLVLYMMQMNCQLLEELTLDYCMNIEKKEAVKIAQGFKSLKKIKFIPRWSNYTSVPVHPLTGRA